MRTHLVLLAAAVLLAAGCAPGADGELRSLVDEVAPADGEMVECNWGVRRSIGALARGDSVHHAPENS
jgi:hypothetical protein